MSRSRAVLNKEAGDARRTAENATERTAKLESGNITLRTDLENARAKLLSAQTRLEREQQKTAAAQKEAARAVGNEVVC
jgi:multidrug resistance efflux pump